jgi:hypothetical protein
MSRKASAGAGFLTAVFDCIIRREKERLQEKKIVSGGGRDESETEHPGIPSRNLYNYRPDIFYHFYRFC